jgi:hypothetical protein
MLYMFLLYIPPGADFPPDIMERHMALWREANAKDAYVSSEALGTDTAVARTVRVRGGRVLTTDGPFAETKEVLGGYYILDCASLDEALAYAAKIPDALAGSVEVRPVLHVPDWPYPDSRRRHPIGA